MEHLSLDYRHGIFYEYKERKIVRGIVDEFDQFRNFHSRESAEQQTNHNGERQFDAHDTPKMFTQFLYSKETPAKRFNSIKSQKKRGAGTKGIAVSLRDRLTLGRVARLPTHLAHALQYDFAVMNHAIGLSLPGQRQNCGELG